MAPADRVCPRRGSVFVEAPARLHFGVLDLRGRLGPPVRRARRGDSRSPRCCSRPRRPTSIDRRGTGRRAGRRVRAPVSRASWAAAGGARSRVHRAIPAHAGLGSGTQLGLAVARALAELHGLPTERRRAGAGVGRGKRSAIGTWAFALGGFIVEGAGGRASTRSRRCWRALRSGQLALRRGGPARSAGAERRGGGRGVRAAAAARRREVERVSHLVLMQLLPALVEADLPGFGAALSAVQRITGAWFAAGAGRRLRPGPDASAGRREMAAWGAAGVGQSSWGPAATAWWTSERRPESWRPRAASCWSADGRVFEGGFAAAGARVWRARNWPRSLIDSSFCRVYTGPSKPPVVGDLAGLHGTQWPGPHCSGACLPWAGNSEKLLAARPGNAASPSCSSLLSTQRGSAASLRDEMGLFPFASTVASMSNSARDRAVRGAAAWRRSGRMRWHRRPLGAARPGSGLPRRIRRPSPTPIASQHAATASLAERGPPLRPGPPDSP